MKKIKKYFVKITNFSNKVFLTFARPFCPLCPVQSDLSGRLFQSELSRLSYLSCLVPNVLSCAVDANRQDITNLGIKERTKSRVQATRKPPRLRKPGNGKRISAVGKKARPKRTEGKRHRNRNGQRKLEQGSINSQEVQRSGH